MTKPSRRTTSFARQIQQSMAELQSIVDRRQSPLGGGRFLLFRPACPESAAAQTPISEGKNATAVGWAR